MFILTLLPVSYVFLVHLRLDEPYLLTQLQGLYEKSLLLYIPEFYVTAIALKGHLDAYAIRNEHHSRNNNPPLGAHTRMQTRMQLQTAFRQRIRGRNKDGVFTQKS